MENSLEGRENSGPVTYYPPTPVRMAPTEGLLKFYLFVNKALYGTFFWLHFNAASPAPDA